MLQCKKSMTSIVTASLQSYTEFVEKINKQLFDTLE